MIELDNRTTQKIDLDLLEKISNHLTNKDIELIITNNEEIKTINNEYRNINKATDVLSFPYEDDFIHTPLGSIVISVDFVIEKAKEYNHSFENELSLLFIHGLLHILGFDHEIDNGEQRNKEEELIKTFNLPNSLIIRNT